MDPLVQLQHLSNKANLNLMQQQVVFFYMHVWIFLFLSEWYTFTNSDERVASN